MNPRYIETLEVTKVDGISFNCLDAAQQLNRFIRREVPDWDTI